MVAKMEVLVVGATGRQGSVVARALLRAGFGVRALTRTLSHPAAESLRLRGARLAWTDLDDERGVAEAMKGVGAVFAVTSAFGCGPAVEVRRGLALARLARELGVGHFIYSSTAAAERPTGVPHHDSKHEIERHLRASVVAHTVVSPAFFMDNLAAGWWAELLRRGLLPLPLGAREKLQQTALVDLGAFVRLVLGRREEFAGRRVAIASDELTPTEMAAILARTLRRPLQHVDPEDLVEPHGRPPPETFDCIRPAGARADVVALRRDYPEVNWHTLDGWAGRQSWEV
jgi:uncharacterized protein YbjT (DUF2867 family)